MSDLKIFCEYILDQIEKGNINEHDQETIYNKINIASSLIPDQDYLKKFILGFYITNAIEKKRI